MDRILLPRPLRVRSCQCTPLPKSASLSFHQHNRLPSTRRPSNCEKFLQPPNNSMHQTLLSPFSSKAKWNEYEKSATVRDVASISSPCSYCPKVLVANGCRIWQNSGQSFH